MRFFSRTAMLRRLGLSFLIVLGVATCLWGEENRPQDITVELQGGIGYMAPPEVVYHTDLTNASKDIETEGDVSYSSGLVIGVKSIEFSYRFDAHKNDEGGLVRNNNTGQAAGYGATGSWADATWDYENKITNHSFGLGYWFNKKKTVSPYIGFLYQGYKQQYDLNSLSASGYRRIFDSELEAEFYGLVLGGELKTEPSKGWQFLAKPIILFSWTDADLRFTQDPDATVGGFVTITDTRSDDAFSGGGSLKLTIRKFFTSRFSLGLSGEALYVFNQPTLQPPSVGNGSASIEWEGAYLAQGMLEFRYIF